jgi:hypothetical protein
MRRNSTVFAPVRCARCWEKLPPGAQLDLCKDCSADFRAVPPQAFGASGVEGTYLAGLDRDYFAERIREALGKGDRK